MGWDWIDDWGSSLYNFLLGLVLLSDTFTDCMSIRLRVVVYACIKQPHGRIWWYGTPVISTTMTVCPTSGSLTEGYKPSNTGDGSFGMEDGRLDRRQGSGLSGIPWWSSICTVSGVRLVCRGMHGMDKGSYIVGYVLISTVSTGIILNGEVYIDIKVGRVRDSANRHKLCVCMCNSNLAYMSHSMRRESGHALDM